MDWTCKRWEDLPKNGQKEIIYIIKQQSAMACSKEYSMNYCTSKKKMKGDRVLKDDTYPCWKIYVVGLAKIQCPC